MILVDIYFSAQINIVKVTS